MRQVRSLNSVVRSGYTIFEGTSSTDPELLSKPETCLASLQCKPIADLHCVERESFKVQTVYDGAFHQKRRSLRGFADRGSLLVR